MPGGNERVFGVLLKGNGRALNIFFSNIRKAKLILSLEKMEETLPFALKTPTKLVLFPSKTMTKGKKLKKVHDFHGKTKIVQA